MSFKESLSHLILTEHMEFLVGRHRPTSWELTRDIVAVVVEGNVMHFKNERIWITSRGKSQVQDMKTGQVWELSFYIVHRRYPTKEDFRPK